MKVSIDIDCTPQEAREFLGLPDVSAMQNELMAKIQVQMEEALTAKTPEELFQTWIPAGVQGMDALGKIFWNAAGMKNPNDKDG
jgi:Family of unknown function (DUF6489)